MRATTKGRSVPPSIRLNIRVLEEAAERRNWVTDRQLANGLGFDPGAISRLLRVRTEPSPRFIAAALNALPELTFEDLFSVSVPDQSERAA